MLKKAGKKKEEETLKGSLILSLGKKKSREREVVKAIKKAEELYEQVEELIEERKYKEGISKGTLLFLEGLIEDISLKNRITERQQEVLNEIWEKVNG